MTNQLPAAVYTQHIEQAQSLLKQLLLKRSRLGWGRLACLLVPALCCYYFLPQQVQAAVICVVAGIACFLFLVSLDTDNNHRISYQQRLIAINEDELLVLQHQYQQRDNGQQFQPALHPYAGDFDLFGDYSLYQYIGRCESQQGKALLAAQLLQAPGAANIVPVQEAITEMATHVNWRQTLQNYGKQAPLQQSTEKRILDWLGEKDGLPQGKLLQLLVKWYPVIPFGCLLLVALEIIPPPVFNLLFFVFLIVSSSLTGKINVIYKHVSRIESEIGSLQLQLMHVEKQTWQSPYLQQLQQQLRGGQQASYEEVLQLKKILNRFDYRVSMAILFLNPFLAWDARQAMALMEWKKHNKQNVAAWFKVIAEMEVLNTLATLKYNQPGWILPQVQQQHFNLHAQTLGHPLIAPEKRVNNSCDIAGTGQIMLITGSNMAGKSTFLRSLGVNMVLAMMGSPVCATAFAFSPVQLVSSMRIADNLAENTSTFYAELKKLQDIIIRVNHHDKVFILLDEILRGTNSLDRHTGSKALIQQLIREKAVAVIATHDVELAAMEQTYPGELHNYHFDVQVSAGELYFDYKLKTGVCQSMNASILMKKIGIEMV
ncbi:MutS-related protein [Deminuibacter soli]|uniref:DNA mismatch repair proteins mutS family domain-containing protein n=1 Tax=Deminuibacter soli TaxID=2291815 RepID=A0A3E1NML6_9BACT|nr:hypothetical protein [Deminuibacter soli]RFM29152.1 hypothetical protein DXN05_08070 [Deminuibacter soli]